MKTHPDDDYIGGLDGEQRTDNTQIIVKPLRGGSDFPQWLGVLIGAVGLYMLLKQEEKRSGR